MRWLVRNVCVWAMGAAAVVAAVAQGSDTVYHLHGSVVNGATGKPIGRALVVSGDRRLATLTDSEGNWSLDVSVPATQQSDAAVGNGGTPSVSSSTGAGVGSLGANRSRFGAMLQNSLQLSAQRPGYLANLQPLSVVLDAKAAEAALVLRLMPSASLHGQVSAEGREPVRNLQITLLQRAVEDGSLVWRAAGGRSVSQDGTFRFSDLQPGEYTVMSSEWNPERNAADALQGKTLQYPAMFLGDTPTLAVATKLRVRSGEAAQADLHLRAANYYPVTVPVQGLPSNAPVNVRVARGQSFNGYVLGWNNQKRRVEGALPDGDYTVLLNSFGAQHASALVPLHVAGAPIQMAEVALAPAQDVVVRIHDERTGQTSQNPAQGMPDFAIYARGMGALEGQGGSAMQTRDGVPSMSNMVPGMYQVRAQAFRGYVASLSSGTTDLLRNPLVIGATGTSDPIDITLRDDGGTVRGVVDQVDTQVPVTLVLLLPTDGSPQMQTTILRPGGDGAYSLMNVAPGSYRVFAVGMNGQNWELPYRDAEAMRAFDGKGVAVTVSAGQTSVADVKALAPDVSGSLP